ncbi:N-acetylmuramoyl-L-alanine amidase [Allostella vacuolata]|nr:N-acetylmuramoyl-L-alanine amidase [Stella vacuolata]
MTGIVPSPSPNHGPRPGDGRVDILVVHYTGMRDAAAALDRLRDPASEVSAHYLIERSGLIHRMVAEDRRAWHAGRGWWQGERDVNGRSIGIELENPGHEWGYLPFPDQQMEALAGLARAILARHPIPPDRVVGHSDIAPRRKADPGELFDWRRLARAGIGFWPDGLEAPVPDAAPFPAGEGLARLGAFGYELDDPAATVTAFQRRFRPARPDGHLDVETLWRIARLRG